MNIQTFQDSPLWINAFVTPPSGVRSEEAEFFKQGFLAMRDKVAQLVARIAVDMPAMTVHDITHLDALWRTASLACGPDITLSPAEAFVLGGAILLHDSAMSLAAYSGGADELSKTVEWKDAAARQYLDRGRAGFQTDLAANAIPSDIRESANQDAMRILHAKQAEVLATKAWTLESGGQAYLIENLQLRTFYGPMIGKLAHSHWWDVEKVQSEFHVPLGPLPGTTNTSIDGVKIAAILRVADVLHLDQLRAPTFLRALVKPEGYSALHWEFQEHMSAPILIGEEVIFTTAFPFKRDQSDSWWLGYETLSYADAELRNTDRLLSAHGTTRLAARAIKGVQTPETMSNYLRTAGWRPVDSRVRATDIPRIISTLGGSQLYGDDPTVALRELIQNAADAINARRILQDRAADWGTIKVSLRQAADLHILSVEDTGVGMSENVLVGPLIDFGKSFWRSRLASEEFPGLVSRGLSPKGTFGIGFFSVFMLGGKVRVFSRRFDRSTADSRLLEFVHGLSSQPLLAPATDAQAPVDGGTRVEVTLDKTPNGPGGLLNIKRWARAVSLADLVAHLAPALDVDIEVEAYGERHMLKANDWKTIAATGLSERMQLATLYPRARWPEMLMPILGEVGEIVGRLSLQPNSQYYDGPGVLTVGGLRSETLNHTFGVLSATTQTADRRTATPIATRAQMALWATEQARIAAKVVDDPEDQALIAELVLSFGGDIGKLKIVRYQDDWMSQSELTAFVDSASTLHVKLDGKVEYDEDFDEVPRRYFDEDFEFNDALLYVPLQSSIFVRNDVTKAYWPSAPNPSHLGKLVLRIIDNAWTATNVIHDVSSHTVGTVGSESITRDVYIFTRAEDSDEPHLK